VEKIEAVSEGSVMRMEGVVEKASLMKVALSRMSMGSWWKILGRGFLDMVIGFCSSGRGRMKTVQGEGCPSSYGLRVL